MAVKAFFDTNILVCAAVGDEPKRRRAMELIESMDFGTSAQVLQEFFVTVVRKAARPLSASQALGRRYPRSRRGAWNQHGLFRRPESRAAIWSGARRKPAPLMD